MTTRRRGPRPVGPASPPSIPPPTASSSPIPHQSSVPDPPPPSFECPECRRAFTTKSGVGLLKRRAHLTVANNEIDVERTKRVWSQEELRIMAREEALASRNGVRFINQHLLAVIPDRTLDAIKGARRGATYKALVAAATQDLAAVDSSSDSSTHLSVGESPTASPLSSSSRATRYRLRSMVGSPPPSSPEWCRMYTDFHTAIRQLNEIAKSIRSWGMETLSRITDDLLSGADVEQAIVAWAENTFPPNVVAGQTRRPTPKIVNPSRKQQRRVEYARLQSLWRKNQSRAAKEVIDGSIADVCLRRLWQAIGDHILPKHRYQSYHHLSNFQNQRWLGFGLLFLAKR